MLYFGHLMSYCTVTFPLHNCVSLLNFLQASSVSMSFLDGSSQSALLDCSEGDMKAGAWGGTDLLDPGGDAADFDISSFFSQLAASTAGVEAAHGSDGLCGPAGGLAWYGTMFMGENDYGKMIEILVFWNER